VRSSQVVIVVCAVATISGCGRAPRSPVEDTTAPETKVPIIPERVVSTATSSSSDPKDSPPVRATGQWVMSTGNAGASESGAIVFVLESTQLTVSWKDPVHPNIGWEITNDGEGSSVREFKGGFSASNRPTTILSRYQPGELTYQLLPFLLVADMPHSAKYLNDTKTLFANNRGEAVCHVNGSLRDVDIEVFRKQSPAQFSTPFTRVLERVETPIQVNVRSLDWGAKGRKGAHVGEVRAARRASLRGRSVMGT